MKYIILNDLLYLKKKWPIVFLVYFTWLLVLVVDLRRGYASDMKCFLGITYDFDYGIKMLIYYFFNISVFILLSQIIYSKDLRYNIDNLFTRISPKKWFIIKMISIFIVTLIFKFLLYLLVFIFYKQVFTHFIYDVLLTTSIQYLFLLILSSPIKYQFSFLLIIILLLAKIVLDNYISINIYEIIIILVIAIILNIILSRYILMNNLERSNM